MMTGIYHYLYNIPLDPAVPNNEELSDSRNVCRGEGMAVKNNPTGIDCSHRSTHDAECSPCRSAHSGYQKTLYMSGVYEIQQPAIVVAELYMSVIKRGKNTYCSY